MKKFAGMTITNPAQLVNTQSVPPNRKCSTCGKTYYRVNKVEVWSGRNEGHRMGWHKDKVRKCNDCMPTSESKRMVTIADVQYSHVENIKPKRKRHAKA